MSRQSASLHETLDGAAVIFFDAVGTLIHPRPAAVEVYAEIGGRFGSRLSKEIIAQRFRHFFRIEETVDRQAGLATDEARERRRWRNIVGGVLDDVEDMAGCFEALYQHFARPDAWCCDPAAESVLLTLRDRGLQLGLASNYDHRLRAVAAGLVPLRYITHLVISSEVGHRKPAGEFFQAMCRVAELPADKILYVGDGLANDFEGARAAGMRALLLDPADALNCPGCLRSLVELEQE